MANQITDGRTSITVADAVTGFVGLGGGAAGTLDTEIFYEGTGSVAYSTSSTRAGLLYDAGSAQDWSNNVFYLLVNCGIVGLLATKASGGLTVRFCGVTVTDWFEVYVAGSDSWPTTFSGGWAQFVVDIEDARSTAVTNGWVNGTPPATTAIQYVGISTITGGTMPRMVDNTWVDQLARLPDGSPGIVIEGQNGGATPWDWADVVAASDTGKWGTARLGAGGTTVLNTPVQFFVDDATTHAFSDTNAVILWDNQEYAPADLYGFTVLGAATGTANLTAGIKTGTGSSATGAQGWTVIAASTGVRWYFDSTAANIDSCGLYGCSFLHAGSLLINNLTTELISSLLIDNSSANISNTTFLRNSVINAATLDGVAFATTTTPDTIEYCSFEFSDGHAVEITATGSFNFSGNKFSGYGATASNDAVIYNNSGGSVTLNILNGGDAGISYRNGAGASTTINASFGLTLTNVPTDTRVVIVDSTTRTELFTHLMIPADAGETTYTHSGGATVDVLLHHYTYEPDISNIYDLTLPSADQTIQVSMFADLDYENP